MFKPWFFAAPILLALTACGSDSESVEEVKKTIEEPTPRLYVGTFLDSAVMGLNYQTSSQSGQTNEAGEFNYLLNEEITFSIGGITLPAIVAKSIITPLDLYQSQNINQLEVINLLRLLQSLDLDGDPSNGIEISTATHEQAQTLELDFSAADFEQQVADFILQSGNANQQLIATQTALTHFQNTLNDISNNAENCTAEHSMVGYSGYFNTFAHNVSGKATIIDDCTIEISEFNYDGGGPEVFFYGAIDHQYASENAFAIGQKLNGQVYENATITIKLPANKTLDNLNGLSVWCIDFAANFGEMEFTP